MKIPLRVPNPPSKPLIIWDGECHFCRRWIERWREITRDAVDYATSQESAERFPEIPREQFERSVIYIETDGSVFFGAEAVFRSLRCRSSKKSGLELRTRSGFCGRFRKLLQNHRF